MNTPLWQKYAIPEDTATPPMSMDYAHVEMLRRVILAVKPRLAVEIGSANGHSVVAFLAAMDELPDMKLLIFEPGVTASLMGVLQKSPHFNRICVHPHSVWNTSYNPDFVFIDGDHGLPALADLAFCLAKSVRTIAMHDTEGLHGCWGSQNAADLLKGMEGREWFADAGETKRGFGVSVEEMNDPEPGDDWREVALREMFPQSKKWWMSGD